MPDTIEEEPKVEETQEETTSERSFTEQQIDDAIEKVNASEVGAEGGSAADYEPRTETETAEVVDAVDDEPSVDDSSSDESSAADTVSETADDDWLEKPEIKELVSTYGFEEADVKALKSEDDLRRLARIVDRQLLSQPAFEETTETPATETTAATTAETEAPADDVAAIMSLNPDDFDDDTKVLIKAVQSERNRSQDLEKRFEEQNQVLEFIAQKEVERQQRDRAAEQAQAMVQFHEVANTLDEHLFGRTENGDETKLTAVQKAQREQLFAQAQDLLGAMYNKARRQGTKPEEFTLPDLPSLFRRAENLSFGDELLSRKQQDFRERVAQQSKSRRPHPNNARRSSAGAGTPAKPVDETVRVANDPAVLAFFDKAEESGVS